MEKIERAEKLMKELEAEVKKYFENTPYEIGIKVENEKPIYYVKEMKEDSSEIRVITGDIIQNLRSALDHIAYNVFLKSGRTKINKRNVYFPIATTKEEFEKIELNWMPKQIMELVTSIKPYKEGNLKIWQLNELNKIDKHRLLLTTGSNFESMDISPHISQFLPSSIKIEPLFLIPKNNLLPLKKGDYLFVGGTGETINPKLQFNIGLIINETEIAKEPLIPFILELINEVKNISQKFMLQIN